MTLALNPLLIPPTGRNDYVLHHDHELGSGSYASVVEATFKGKIAGRRRPDLVAKCVSFRRRRARETFEREVDVLRAVHGYGYPNLVRYWTHWATEDMGVIVMDRLPGMTLEKYVLKHGALSEYEALKVLQQVAAAVHHVFLLGYSIMDVKPENIMYEPRTGRAILFDFGLAVKLEYRQNLVTGESELKPCFSHGCSPMFAAPEVLLGDPYDSTLHDVWSLGQVAYFMVYGKAMFHTCDRMSQLEDLMRQVYTDGSASVAQFQRMSFSDPFQTMLRGVLHGRPEKRWNVVRLLDFLTVHFTSLERRSLQTLIDNSKQGAAGYDSGTDASKSTNTSTSSLPAEAPLSHSDSVSDTVPMDVDL